MKRKTRWILCLALLLVFICGCAKQTAPAETAASSTEAAQTPTTEPTVPATTVAPTEPTPTVYRVKTADGLLTIDLPNSKWYQIISDENTEMFSDGDCAILVNLYRSTDKLPATVTSDDNHAMIYTASVSAGDYILNVVGYAHNQSDFSGIGRAINSIVVDKDKITPNMLKHEVNVSEYSIRDASYAAWVASTNLNVRAASGTDSAILTTLRQNDQLTVTGTVLKNGQEIGWSRVRLQNGTLGYVSSQFLTTSDPQTRVPTKTGAAKTLYTDSGATVTIYEYSDGSWKDNSGIAYRHEVESAWYGSNGNVLYTYNPSEPYPTGSTCTLYTSEGTAVTLYMYSDGEWRDGNKIKYWHTTSDNYTNDYGTILYVQNPAAQPYRTGYTQTWYDEYGNVVILYAYSDNSWRDEYGDQYWVASGDSMGNASGRLIYDHVPTSSPRRTGATQTWYDEYVTAVTLYAYSDNSWRDENGDQYWVVSEGCMGNSSGKLIYDFDHIPQH